MARIIMSEMLLLEMKGLGVIELQVTGFEIRPGANERRWKIALTDKSGVIAEIHADILDPSEILKYHAAKLGIITPTERQKLNNQIKNFLSDAEEKRRSIEK